MLGVQAESRPLLGCCRKPYNLGGNPLRAIWALRWGVPARAGAEDRARRARGEARLATPLPEDSCYPRGCISGCAEWALNGRTRIPLGERNGADATEVLH